MPIAEVKKVMGFRKMDAIVLLLGKFAPDRKDDEVLVDRIHTRFIDNMIEFYRNDETLAPFPHAEAVFRSLKQQGIKVALNTGFTRAITDTILHRLRWDDRSALIDRVICSDEVPNGRPHADMIGVLMDDLGIDSPEQVLKVGDTEVDVEEGRNAACGKVVSVTTGAYTREQLRPSGPDFIIDDLQELLPIIEQA
jgi:phosphonatase-like hydrolase